MAASFRFLLHALALFVLLQTALTTASQAAIVVDKALMVREDAAGDPIGVPAPVELPYNWDSKQGGAEGRVRYLIDFPIETPSEPHALLIPRIGNTFEIVLNGVPLARMGTHGNSYQDYSKQPRFFLIPPNLLRAENRLAITTHAQSARHAGLSRVIVGPDAELEAIYDHTRRWHTGAFVVIITVSAVLGGLSLLLWLRQRETLYVYYGLAELLWAFRIGDIFYEETLLPWPWPGLLTFSAYAIAPNLICKFSLVIVDAHRGWLKQLGDWQMALSVPVMAVALFGRMPRLVSAWLGLTVALCVVVAYVVLMRSLRSKTFEQKVLGVAVILISAAAVRDMVVFRILNLSFGSVAWVGYAWVGFGITLMWVISERLRRSRQEVAAMNQVLMQRLAQREAELQTSFVSRTEAERRGAMMEERQRLMRDMHDGLGSQLLGTLQMARNESVSRQTLVEQLHDALDHVKLTVDAMQDTEGDIAALLGALRYRLGPRLQASGIQLTWSVDTLPAIPGWTIQHSRDLQMILFEAFSNLIAHAGADRAALTASVDPASHCIRITLADNGKGMEGSSASHGHGLLNMRARAARISACLDIEADDDGTQVTLTLPLEAGVAAA
jgi:signal transduction histidine kinase